MPEVMLTKLLPPRISNEIIERPRLLELLNRNRNVKLVMVTAPAGYGKTVSILQYVYTLETPFVWYQLDQYDNDPAVFIQYLITGIQAHFHHFGTEVLQLVLQSNIASSLHFIVITIVNELAALSGKNLVLVLDDYHVINEPLIQQFMQELLEHLPTGIRIIINSRTSPALPFSRFQVRNEIELVDSEILRFNITEIKKFLLKKQVNASQELIDTLVSRTDGWPAALKLITEATFKKGPNLSAKETQFIYDYLANEIFYQQPEEVRDFLLATAVLEVITPEICDLLLERNDSRQVLERLERLQLFLIPLAGEQTAYRYHQLFRDFLIERLGSRRIILLRKVGAIALQNGNLDQAVEFFLTAGFEQDLLTVFEKAVKEAFRQGRWQTVERWLGMLSPEQISSDEWVCFFQAKIQVYQGKLDEAEIWIEKSREGFSVRQDPVGIAECQFLQARIYNQRDRISESLALLEKAYPVLLKEGPLLRFDLPLEMGLTLFKNGRLQEAERILTQAVQEAMQQNEFRIMAHLWEGLGHIYYWMGEYSKAIQCYQKGIKVSPTQTLPSYNFQDFTADIYLEWGETDLALEYAQKSVAFKEKMGLFEPLPSAYLQLGGVYFFSGEVEKAEIYLRKGITLAEKNGGERLFLSMNKGLLSFCLMVKGRFAEALTLTEEVLSEAESQSELLLASCRVICAPVLIGTGENDRAKDLLKKAILPLEEYKFAIPLSYAYANLALLYFQSGELQEAGELACKVLKLAADKNLLQHFLTHSEFQVFLRYGMENGIEVSFIQRILVRLRERGIKLLTELANHPDSQVRIRTILPLAQINTPVSQELLELLSNDQNSEVRKTVQQYANITRNIGTWKNAPSDLMVSGINQDLTRKTKGNIQKHDSKTIPLLQLNLLGPARIILNNTEITNVNWRFTKSRDLLLYLCHQGQPVEINRVLEDLWPDFPLEKGMNNFYNVLHCLRQIIKRYTPVKLVTYASKICQLLPSFYTTDCNRFISLINAGSFDNKDSGRNIQILEEAVAIYQGEYLNQLDYPWIISEREHFKRLYLETLLRLAKFYLQSQDYLKIVKILKPLTIQNPLHEEIFGLLMSAYAKLGDRLAVISQYQKLKSNLVDELGLEPAPEITKLYYKLCGSDTSTHRRLRKRKG